jgi:hypothetical protein
LDVDSLMSESPTNFGRSPEDKRGAPLEGESITPFGKSPGHVEIFVNNVDSLFDWDARPTYPHGGPMLNEGVARFMVSAAREAPRSPEVRVAVTFRTTALRTEEEAGTRAQVNHFFANEAKMAELDLKVNRVEALRSLRFAIPVVIIAGLIAGLISSVSTSGGAPYLTELAYLSAVVIIWVMLWDPAEKLLFDSYFIRLRIRALHKLARAKINFVYRPGPAGLP